MIAGKPVVYVKANGKYAADPGSRSRQKSGRGSGGWDRGRHRRYTYRAAAGEQVTGGQLSARRLRRVAIGVLLVCAVAGATTWYGMRAYRNINGPKAEIIPTAKVVRGDVTLDVTARGELRGGDPEVLFAPATGGLDLHLTSLKDPGEQVTKGEVVAEFDTTEQTYKLKEAQADLAEAEAHLAQARAQNDAQDEEDRYALLKAQSDVRTAELDVRRNPLLPALLARENTLALDAAKDHLTQLQHNLANRKATNEAAIGIQEAARGKAASQAKTARQHRGHDAAHPARRLCLHQAELYGC